MSTHFWTKSLILSKETTRFEKRTLEWFKFNFSAGMIRVGVLCLYLDWTKTETWKCKFKEKKSNLIHSSELFLTTACNPIKQAALCRVLNGLNEISLSLSLSPGETWGRKIPPTHVRTFFRPNCSLGPYAWGAFGVGGGCWFFLPKKSALIILLVFLLPSAAARLQLIYPPSWANWAVWYDFHRWNKALWVGVEGAFCWEVITPTPRRRYAGIGIIRW